MNIFKKHLAVFVFFPILLLAFFIFFPNSASASSASAYCGSAANDTTPSGGSNWTNPTNVQGNTPSTYATSTANNSTVTSFYVDCTSFGFSLPAGSTINGIQVDIVRHNSKVGSG